MLPIMVLIKMETIPISSKDMNKFFTVSGNANEAAALENSMAIF
jgi:hypothetical protein